jgi:hypothetical protein
MSDKARSKHKSRKKDRPPRPAVDTLTVVWMTTLVTCLMTFVPAMAIRGYVAFGNPDAMLLKMLSAYFLITSALVGLFLIILTPIVVRRGRSNPPLGVVIAAYVLGALPLLAMVVQGTQGT